MHRSQKWENDSEVNGHFVLLGSMRLKAARKHFGEIDPRSWSAAEMTESTKGRTHITSLKISESSDDVKQTKKIYIRANDSTFIEMDNFLMFLVPHLASCIFLCHLSYLINQDPILQDWAQKSILACLKINGFLAFLFGPVN